MASEVEIVNLALVSHLNEDPVEAVGLESDPSRVSKVRAVLPQALDAILEKHGWLCCLEYATIEPVEVDGDWRFPVRYYMPEGGLRFWDVDRTDGWEFGVVEDGDADRKILRAVTGGSLNVSYVKRRRWGALDAHLVDLVALEAAQRACVNVTGDRTLAADLRKQVPLLLATAISADGTDAQDVDTTFGDRVALVRAQAG